MGLTTLISRAVILYTHQRIRLCLKPGIPNKTQAIILPLISILKNNAQVYIVDIDGTGKPKELTSGKQGATHSPIFNSQGTKVAWLELDQDGYESDRSVPNGLTQLQTPSTFIQGENRYL